MSEHDTMTRTWSATVTGRDVVVLGGGPAALGDVTGLLAAGARVRVVAPHLTDALHDLVLRGLVTHEDREPRLEDLQADLVVRPTERLADQRGSGPDAGTRTGTVTLVGAGPGDPGLLTVAGRDAIMDADVLVTDRLVPHEVLRELAPLARIVDVAKIPHGRSTPQEHINAVLVEAAQAGERVVRLKGGDPFVFGRGGEEVLACTAAGVPVRVIPGVTSAVAGPGLAGIPVTHRGTVQGFTVVSGHVPPDDPASTLDYAALAGTGTTLVVLMGVRTLPAITAALVRAGLDPATPAAVVADAGLASQRVVHATVTDIAERATAAGLGAPAVAVIGAVADLGLTS